MSWFGPQPEYGYPDFYMEGYKEPDFKNEESLTKAQKRLVRLAQEKVVEQIIVGDDERKLAGWQFMHVTMDAHKHQKGRYELARARRGCLRAPPAPPAPRDAEGGPPRRGPRTRAPPREPRVPRR